MSKDPVLYNKGAEKAVLGSCLLDGTVIHLVDGGREEKSSQCQTNWVIYELTHQLHHLGTRDRAHRGEQI